MFLAIGLVAHGRYMTGPLTGSAAFLLHAPTTYPFWIVYAALALWPQTRRKCLYGLAVLLGALVLLWIASRTQSGGAQVETFLARLDAGRRNLQRASATGCLSACGCCT